MKSFSAIISKVIVIPILDPNYILFMNEYSESKCGLMHPARGTVRELMPQPITYLTT